MTNKPSTSVLANTTVLNTKNSKFENKIPEASGLVTQTLNTKVS